VISEEAEFSKELIDEVEGVARNVKEQRLKK